MKERPILFSGEMARAILDGRKSQTRRVVNPQPTFEDDGMPHLHRNGEVCLSKFTGWPQAVKSSGRFRSSIMPIFPYGVAGDRLWVRETWAAPAGGVMYRADGEFDADMRALGYTCKWKPAIFMPRELSRITLEVLKVEVQRVQDITEQDTLAEGVCRKPGAGPHGYPSPDAYRMDLPARAVYQDLWDSINAKRGDPKGCYAWDKNPWVWVLEFRRCNNSNPDHAILPA